ncbi:hypothetical protein EG68_12280 [Paragonimus skrjabini miyazakii]|uniref:Reverse transcriptase domain-containing protein n=1 Tax=Paragonimus skrjabini miyazakii TaxID=59628 RepID=A0A8S9YJS1_9TREM|nr:hypothetical protein EG68_12280 [Paragonimus skrjabini miyazakii]
MRQALSRVWTSSKLLTSANGTWRLLHNCLTSCLSRNRPRPNFPWRDSFVPKVDEPATPADYRPIAVSSLLQRMFHKILARRLHDTVEFSSLQVAFQKNDGCLEASPISVHGGVMPIADAFLDISKTFDSVSHDTILRCAKRHELPPPLIQYLKRLYDD